MALKKKTVQAWYGQLFAQRTHHLDGKLSFLVENFRCAAPAAENFGEVRWLEAELIHTELYRLDRIGRINPMMFLLVGLD